MRPDIATRALVWAPIRWLSIEKGILILWIVGFHLFRATRVPFVDLTRPAPLDQLRALCEGAAGEDLASCLARGGVGATMAIGYHAVNVFFLLSGFALAQGLGDAVRPATGWLPWYRRRLLRIFPLYWTAHLLLAVSPFTLVFEPIDYRFLISLTGLRLWPIAEVHSYFNAAWWYVTALIQLYLVFPLLWWIERRLGPACFAGVAIVGAAAVRWVMLVGWPVGPQWTHGAFGLTRVGEFGVGMALGVWYARDAAGLERRLFRGVTMIASVAVYLVALASFRALWSYTLADALVGIGLFGVGANLAQVVGRVAGVGATLARIGDYSYGLYLFHQPYVLYFGLRWQHLATLPFLGASTLLVAALVAGSMLLEMAVERLVGATRARRVALAETASAP